MRKTTLKKFLPAKPAKDSNPIKGKQSLRKTQTERMGEFTPNDKTPNELGLKDSQENKPKGMPKKGESLGSRGNVAYARRESKMKIEEPFFREPKEFGPNRPGFKKGGVAKLPNKAEGEYWRDSAYPKPSKKAMGGKVKKEPCYDEGESWDDKDIPMPSKRAMGGRCKKLPNRPEGESKKAGGMCAKDGMWIQDAIKHKGALHKSLGIPAGKKIPEAKLEKAEHSKNPLTRKRANLAETLKKMHKK